MKSIELPRAVKTVMFQTLRYISFWSVVVLAGIIILFQISQKLGLIPESDLGHGWVIILWVMLLVIIGLAINLLFFIIQTTLNFGLVHPRLFSNFFYGRVLFNLTSHEFLQGTDIRLKATTAVSGRILIITDLEKSFNSLSSWKRLTKTNTSSEIDLSDAIFK